jgi:hyperosmotically inducible periplasmic protein
MRVILILAICIVIGVVGLNYLKQHKADDGTTDRGTQKIKDGSSDLADRARDAAHSAKDSISRHMSEWHLTADDIKKDLQKGGEIVRTKAQSAGSSIASSASNAKLVTMIQAKYTLDKDLSPRAISVSANEGHVLLTGTVASEDLIGRAVGLALDTDGVVEVKSQLVVGTP